LNVFVSNKLPSTSKCYNGSYVVHTFQYAQEICLKLLSYFNWVQVWYSILKHILSDIVNVQNVFLFFPCLNIGHVWENYSVIFYVILSPSVTFKIQFFWQKAPIAHSIYRNIITASVLNVYFILHVVNGMLCWPVCFTSLKMFSFLCREMTFDNNSEKCQFGSMKFCHVNNDILKWATKWFCLEKTDFAVHKYYRLMCFSHF